MSLPAARVPIPAAPARARGGLRVSFRWKGVFALLAIVALAVVLLAAAMAFRAAVEQDLDGIAQAHAEGAAIELARHVSEARQHSAAATVTLACIAWFGITLIGALSLLFFTRIAGDIGAVRARALAIVVGERGSGPTLG